MPFSQISACSRHSEAFICNLEASWKLSVRIRRPSRIRENLDFLGPYSDLSSCTIFSKTHKQTRDLHRWMALDLIYKKKLLRGKTNSQIARYLHFCDLSPENFDSPFEIKFPMPLYYSSLERLYESCVMLAAWGRSPFQG